MAEELDMANQLAAANATLDHVEDRLADLLDDYGFARPDGLAEALDMLSTAFQVGSWLHAEAVQIAHHESDNADQWCTDLERSESSRQAWAEEAMRLDAIAEAMTNAAAMNDDRLRFVAARYLADGSGANFRRGRCTGVSSDALAWFAVGRRSEPEPRDYPRDPADLAACERTYEMAPPFLQERMAPVLARYRAAVAKDYPEVASVLPEGEAP